jgi:hypothetical protein
MPAAETLAFTSSLSGVPAFKFSLEVFVGCSAIGDNLKILVMTGACVVLPTLGNNVAIPPEYYGNREERLCIGLFGLAEQMCGRINKQLPFTTSGAEAFG